ncbi:hypothetical protein GCM10010267_05880 [Streptomyces griseorubens]|nr:hypothetical protein GCM10010267_05880 [Streptomyces griseorubens]
MGGGQEPSAPGTPGLPNSFRQAATAALTGFHSQIARSQTGMPTVCTNPMDSAGRLRGHSESAICSDGNSSPRYVPIQDEVQRHRSRTQASATARPRPS